ncbi:hypothetical protein [Streptomyces sp. ST1015]|uniref:hypothetical protein n=1 Tax=unclassified Streptomyces TaxID=2593676 RepID=UPI0013A6BD00|nr:hypothetical protein [Streptomyces sp. ST1015]QZZ27855.1 hypothetical protein A7X85_17610 [Streptomyces sp. ST1015]
MTISAESEFGPVQVLAHAAQRSAGQLRVDQSELPAGAAEVTFTASAPEWTPDAAAWVTEQFGAGGSVAISVSRGSG